MSGECRQFEKALARGPEAVEALEVHAASCGECGSGCVCGRKSRKRLRRSRRSGRARICPRGSPARSRPGRRKPGKPPRRRAAPRRRLAWIPAAAAAALFVLSMIGLSVFKPGESARDPLTRPSYGKEPLLGDETLKEVETAEANYLASIAKLSQLAQARMANPDSPVMASYREKLQLLDSAIADLRAQLEGNRFNTHLRKELMAMYQEKKRTLEQVVKEVKS